MHYPSSELTVYLGTALDWTVPIDYWRDAPHYGCIVLKDGMVFEEPCTGSSYYAHFTACDFH